MTQTPPVPGELLRVIEAEANNFASTTAYLGQTLELIQDFTELYQRLVDTFVLQGTGKITKNEEQQFAAAACLHLVMKSRKDFTLGVLQLLRAYRGMALVLLRGATEACAFAARIIKHPHLGNVWLNAALNGDAYEKYKDKFTNLFPKDDELLTRLFEFYDRSSKTIHNSIYSLAAHLSYGTEEGKSVIKMNAFDLPEGYHVVTALYYTLDAHKLILKIFARSLKEHIKELNVWETRYNAVEAKLDFHREKWKTVVPAPGKDDEIA